MISTLDISPFFVFYPLIKQPEKYRDHATTQHSLVGNGHHIQISQSCKYVPSSFAQCWHGA